jgi:hypothetical protein
VRGLENRLSNRLSLRTVRRGSALLGLSKCFLVRTVEVFLSQVRQVLATPACKALCKALYTGHLGWNQYSVGCDESKDDTY